jgi:hypothetical protein
MGDITAQVPPAIGAVRLRLMRAVHVVGEISVYGNDPPENGPLVILVKNPAHW